MYNYVFVRRTLRAYFSQSPAGVSLRDFLHKSEDDMVFLFQNSQFGWRFFKSLAKSRCWVEICKNMDLLNKDAFYDWAYEKLAKDIWFTHKPSVCDDEINYLTKFFCDIIIKGAGRDQVYREIKS